jgi:hypothetical protein
VRGCLIALSVLTGIIVPAGTALAAHGSVGTSGDIGIRLADASADSRNNPLARSYIVDRLAPGKSIRRRVAIINSTPTTANVAVYPAAASMHRGSFAFASRHGQNQLSTWTSVSQDILRLPPGTSAFETVAITVPLAASPGERYGVIWAEISAPAPSEGGVTLVNRVGIRMYVSIRPGGVPQSNFSIGTLTADRSASGEPTVVANIHNNGPRTLSIRGDLTLSKGPGGLRAGPFPVTLGAALAPGDSDLATTRLDARLPRGPWRVHIDLRSGQLERVAATTITFPLTISHERQRNGRGVFVVVGLLALLAAAALPRLLSRRGTPTTLDDHSASGSATC